jgi:hypothetical protein
MTHPLRSKMAGRDFLIEESRTARNLLQDIGLPIPSAGLGGSYSIFEALETHWLLISVDGLRVMVRRWSKRRHPSPKEAYDIVNRAVEAASPGSVEYRQHAVISPQVLGRN